MRYNYLLNRKTIIIPHRVVVKRLRSNSDIMGVILQLLDHTPIERLFPQPASWKDHSSLNSSIACARLLAFGISVAKLKNPTCTTSETSSCFIRSATPKIWEHQKYAPTYPASLSIRKLPLPLKTLPSVPCSFFTANSCTSTYQILKKSSDPNAPNACRQFFLDLKFTPSLLTLAMGLKAWGFANYSQSSRRKS